MYVLRWWYTVPQKREKECLEVKARYYTDKNSLKKYSKIKGGEE
jgi:hypothetical protein